jgi:hypothetical protein
MNRSRPRRSAPHCAATHLALVDQVGERTQGLVDVGVDVRSVHLVEVDPISLKPPETVLALANDPPARVATVVAVLAHGHEDLGSQDDVVSASLEGLPYDFLRLSRRVHVSGIDEVDPGIEGGVDDAD